MAPSVIPMRGPPADSLLGFLSLLGLLRSLDEVMPERHPMLSWDDRMPRLHLDGDAVQQDVAGAAARGITAFGKKMVFSKPDPGVDVAEFTTWQETMDPELVGAIGSDACLKKNETKVETTALCMMFGSGRQNFLTRLAAATAVGDGDLPAVQKELHDALFSRWQYKDTVPKIAFRWDPTEYRPHASQATDPKKDLIQTVNGANRLAAVGFTACQCVPTRRGLSTVSCMDGGARVVYALWPIWPKPLSLRAITTAMRLPLLRTVAAGGADASAFGSLRAYGINAIMRAELFWDDKFKNARAATPVV